MIERRIVMKGLIGSLVAALGASRSGAAALGTATEVTKAGFPFPLIAVRGEHALAQWERMRAEGGGYPVILGDDEALGMITEFLAFEDLPPVEATLAKAAEISFPDHIFEMRRKEEANYAASYPEDYAEQVADGFYQEPVGEWPAVAPESPALTVHEDILTGQPFERVYIATFPTLNGWEVPAYLSWGGWNANPGPEVHVAALKVWNERFGAELVGISSDVMNIRVSRLPEGREEAMALAREQYAYCEDIVDQGVETISNLAASLSAAKWWYFWWD